MKHQRDTQLLHPIFQKNLTKILEAIQKKLPSGHKCQFIFGHRTQAEQFDLFKKGRKFKNGSWVIAKKSEIVTNINGITKLSMHNYLPAISIDIGIFDAKGNYLGDSPLYLQVKEGAKIIKAKWGGDWKNFKDFPHIELDTQLFFKKDIVREIDYQWQLLLQKSGHYSGVLDGFFGTKSLVALKNATGIHFRNIDSWKKLVEIASPL